MSFWTRFADTITPWERRGEVERRKRREEEQQRQQSNTNSVWSQGNQSRPTSSWGQQTQPTPQTEQQDNFWTRGDSVGLTPQSNRVSVPQVQDPINKELNDLKEQYKKQALEEEKSRTSWFGRQFTDRGWDKRAEATAINRAVRDLQERRGWKPDTRVDQFQKGAAKSIEEAGKNSGSKWLAPVLSAGRVGTGIVQGNAGLYDILTPGKGQNRLTQSTNRKAEEIDKLAEDFGMKNLYRTVNVPMEVASYFTPAAFSKASKPGGIGSRIVSRFGKNRVAREGLQELVDPRNLQKEAELTGRYLGQDSAHGKAITPRVIAENVAQSVGGAFISPLLRGGFRALRRPGERAVEELDTKAIDVTLDALEKDLNTRNVPVSQAVDEGSQVVVRTPDNQRPLVREFPGDAPNATRVPTQAQAAEQRASNRFRNQDWGVPDDRIEGVTARTPEAPYQLTSDAIAESQNKLIDDYAAQLKQMGEGNGTQLVPDGEGGYLRTSNNVRFGDTKGKRMTNAMWREEAERQLRSGKAESTIQKAFDDASNPEVQSLVAQNAPTPDGQPIKVQEVQGIDVRDETNIPQGLPEKPGTVRATASNAPAKTQAEAVAAAQPPTPPTKDLPKSEFDEGELPTTQADKPTALPKSDAEFNREMFINKTGADLQRASKALRELKKMRKGENSARFARADKAREVVQRAGGTFEEAEAAYYNALGGQLSKAGYEGSGFDFNTEQGKRLLGSIDKFTEGRPADKGNLRRSFNRLFNYGQDGVDTLQPGDVKRIRAFYNQVIPDEQLGDGIEQAIRELDELDKAEPGNIKKFLGLQRALLFTADVGSMLRQSLGAGVRHPKMWAESVSDGFKALASPQKFEEMRRFLETDRVANYAKERGLDLTMMGKGAGEEQFRNAEWAQRIPGVGKVVDASQRFFDAQTNMLRYKNFKKFVDSAGGIGKLERAGGDNPDQFVGAIVNVVNTNTGRGTFGKLGSPEAGWLNEVFNSPKGLAARINRVNPKYYVDLARTNPAAAKEALSSLVIQSGLTAAILGTAAANGNYEDGKIKVGNTRYDITGGTATMFSTLKDMSDAFTGSGDASPWKNAGTELDQWFKNQLTPAINTSYDLITSIPQEGTKFTDFKRQDLYGNEITPMSFLIDSFLPLGAQGAIEDLTENGTSLTQTGVNALTNAVGIGTNTYQSAEDKDNATRAETADQVNSELQKIAGTGLLSEQMIADIDDEDVRDILTGKSDKQLSEDELKKVRNKLVEGVGTGTGSDSDTAYRERGEYDKDLAALRLKKEMLEAEPNAKPSDIKGLEVQIKRSELLRDNDIPFELLELYQSTGVEDWRKLEEDDPKMFQQLFALDELFTKAGGSYKSGSFTENKYYQKDSKGGSGRGRGRSGSKFSTDFGKLTGSSPFAPRVREYATLEQSTGAIPRIKRTNPNIVYQIREGRL